MHKFIINLDITELIQNWALHNGITLLAARVRKPKDKALVESEVKLAYQRIYAPLRDQLFFSLLELNAAMLEQLSVHHQRHFQRKDANRYIRFTITIIASIILEVFVNILNVSV